MDWFKLLAAIALAVAVFVVAIFWLAARDSDLPYVTWGGIALVTVCVIYRLIMSTTWIRRLKCGKGEDRQN